MMPLGLKKYFWDSDFKKIDPETYPYFVIERILEHGDEKAVRWMMQNFRKPQIKQVLLKRRGLSPKTAVYWSLIFKVPKNKVLCLKKSYQKTQKSHWSY